ncbi:MAG: radical SAM protein [Thermodesulfobacteriota bacterium]|nr:radical SAM protein [Thermodesulfobacteriota bacterium]
MKTILSLTHQCNLACRYCYAGNSRKPDMTLDMAKRCVDAALTWLSVDSQLDLGLFGGEPLLRFDLIEEIVAYTHQRSGETSMPVRIFITTNGTLVSSEILDYFAEKSIRLCFSLDGQQEIHNRNRCYKNGRGSFAEVVRHLEMAIDRLGVVEVNAVVGPDSLAEVPQTLDFFLSLGIPVIHFNPDIMAKWPADACNRFDDIYRQVAERYIACFRRSSEIALNLIDSKAILFVKGGYTQGDKCSMGDGEWGIAPSGNIYPCERFIGEDDDPTFCLGNIKTGLNQERRCALRSKRGNSRLECSTCFYNRFCMSWCGCTNWFMSGASNMPAPVLCAMEKAAIEAARYAFETLVKDDNDLFADHLFNYVNNDNRCRLANVTTNTSPDSEEI